MNPLLHSETAIPGLIAQATQAKATLYTLQEFLAYFSGRGYACYALSLRGQGTGDREAGSKGNTLGGTAEDIAHFIASLAPAPVVVAHSFGGLAMQRCSFPVSPACLLLSPPTCHTFSLRTSGRVPSVASNPMHSVDVNICSAMAKIRTMDVRTRRLYFDPKIWTRSFVTF